MKKIKVNSTNYQILDKLDLNNKRSGEIQYEYSTCEKHNKKVKLMPGDMVSFTLCDIARTPVPKTICRYGNILEL